MIQRRFVKTKKYILRLLWHTDKQVIKSLIKEKEGKQNVCLLLPRLKTSLNININTLPPIFFNEKVKIKEF